jgi:hypothetical protein
LSGHPVTSTPEGDRPAADPRRCRQQPECALDKSRLAAAGLADQRDELAGGNRKTDPIDSGHPVTPPAAIVDGQIRDLQQRMVCCSDPLGDGHLA